MSEQTTTSPYGSIGTYSEPTTSTAEALGAQWEVTYKLGLANYHTGELNLGRARTQEVKINGVRYRGTIHFTWDPATGDVDYHFGHRHYEWDRLAADGSVREHGLTDKAYAHMQNAARTLHHLFPAPTAADIRDMIAESAHVSARKSVAELEKGMQYIVEAMGPTAEGLRWTIAEAFAAEFRRALGHRGVETSTAWGNLPVLQALGGGDTTAPGVHEDALRANQEAEASAYDEQARITRISAYTAAADRERAIAYGTARAQDLRAEGNDAEAARYEARVARLRADTA